MFVQNQERVYQQMDGIKNIHMEKANPEESEQFWSNICDNEKEHEKNVKCLRELYEKSKNISSWKSPGSDRIQGYWLKKLIKLHECIGKQIYNIVSTREGIPKWMALVKTVLCQKDRSKRNAVDNYRPISFRP